MLPSEQKSHQGIYDVKLFKKHQCKICQKHFKRPILLSVHQRVHTGEKPLKCVKCNKNYYCKSSLDKHLKSPCHLKNIFNTNKTKVEIEKKFKCHNCGLKFFRRPSMLQHVDTMHNHKEPLKCEQCDYNTKIKSNLRRHMQFHSEVKQHKCTICEQAFKTQTTLKEHNLFKHSDIRQFLCEVEKCNKSFKNRSDLHRHSKCHSEERPFKCSSCDRTYKRLSHLKRHLETSSHSMESLHNCDQNDTFNQDSCDDPLSISEISDIHSLKKICNKISRNTINDTLENNKDQINFISTFKENNFTSNELKVKVVTPPSITETVVFTPLVEESIKTFTGFITTKSIDSSSIFTPKVKLTSNNVDNNNGDSSIVKPTSPMMILGSNNIPQVDSAFRQPVLTLTDSITNGNLRFLHLIPTMEKPTIPLAITTQNQIPVLSDVDNQVINISEQASPQNAAVDEPNSSENNKSIALASAIEQGDTITKTELSIENLIENEALHFNHNYNCTAYPISTEQSPMVNLQISPQMNLSILEESFNTLPIFPNFNALNVQSDQVINNETFNLISTPDSLNMYSLLCDGSEDFSSNFFNESNDLFDSLSTDLWNNNF